MPRPPRCRGGAGRAMRAPTGCSRNFRRVCRGGSPSRPSALGRFAVGSMRTSTPTHRTRRGGLYIRPCPAISQVPPRAHIQCAPTTTRPHLPRRFLGVNLPCGRLHKNGNLWRNIPGQWAVCYVITLVKKRKKFAPAKRIDVFSGNSQLNIAICQRMWYIKD